MKSHYAVPLVSAAICSALVLNPGFSFATSCTGGTSCTVSAPTDWTAQANGAGSHLTYINDVEIATSSASSIALKASAEGQITFDGNVHLKALAPTHTVNWASVEGGGTVEVKGNMVVDSSSTASNPGLQVSDDSSILRVDGDLTFTVKEPSAGTSSSSMIGINVKQGGRLSVGGETRINGDHLKSSGITLNVNDSGKADFSDLYVSAKLGQAIVVNKNRSELIARGHTDVVSTNGAAIWVGGGSFISLGESGQALDDFKNEHDLDARRNYVLIGANASVTGGSNGILILGGSQGSLTVVKGHLEGTGGTAFQASRNGAAADTIMIQGGTVVGNANMENGDDAYHMQSGVHTGDVYMGAGADTVELSGGKVIGDIWMGSGQDRGHITGTFDYSELARFNGGSNGSSENSGALEIDHFNLRAYTDNNGFDLSNGLNLTGWDQVNLSNGSTVVMTTNSFLARVGGVTFPSLSLDATSTLTNELGSPDTQTIRADVTNAGSLRLDGNEIAGDTWIISGNYHGDDGLVVFDTVLGDDSSTTDFLTIRGDVTGTTRVQVINRGGLGALTTGDGIQLVQVDGTSTPDAFAMQSDYEYNGRAAVVGGAYAYSLYAGDAGGTFNGDWYLRSLLMGTTPDGENPVYQPGVPVYEVYPQALQALNRLGTLEQRVGARTWLNTGTPEAQIASTQSSLQPSGYPQTNSEIDGQGFWIKVEGERASIDPASSTSNADYDTNMVKTQVGLDVTALDEASGKLVAGGYVRYGYSYTDVSSPFGSGSIKTNGYGGGATLTWYGNNDFYIDGVAQVMWFDSSIKSSTLKRTEVSGNNGIGYAFSLETGKRYDLGNEWKIVPQAQLTYSRVNFKTFTDAFGAKVSRENADFLTGRLGVAFDRQRSWAADDGTLRRMKNYAIANVYYDFLDGTEVAVSNVSFKNRSSRLWGGIGGGLSYNWKDDKYSVYAEMEARTSLSDFGDSYALMGTAGFKMKF